MPGLVVWTAAKHRAATNHAILCHCEPSCRRAANALGFIRGPPAPAPSLGSHHCDTITVLILTTTMIRDDSVPWPCRRVHGTVAPMR